MVITFHCLVAPFGRADHVSLSNLNLLQIRVSVLNLTFWSLSPAIRQLSVFTCRCSSPHSKTAHSPVGKAPAAGFRARLGSPVIREQQSALRKMPHLARRAKWQHCRALFVF